MEIILGLIILYSVGHFFVIQHNNNLNDRSNYQKVVSELAIISVALIFLGLMNQ